MRKSRVTKKIDFFCIGCGRLPQPNRKTCEECSKRTIVRERDIPATAILRSVRTDAQVRADQHREFWFRTALDATRRNARLWAEFRDQVIGDLLKVGGGP
jgi:hypothetical protein